MKTTKQLFKLMLLLIMCMLASYCSKDSPIETTPTGSTETKEPTIVDTDGGGDVSIVSDNIIQTATGYEFNGLLKAKNDQGEEFDVVDGDISVEVGDDGVITGISGEGSVNFPNIGNFKGLLKNFDWKEKVKSHIEYKKGSEYKSDYNTDLPLNDDIRYYHFQVFDEEKDGRFELRSKLNDKIYDFVDFYLDPNDPAIFFSVQLGIGKKIMQKLNKGKSGKKLMDKIKDKLNNTDIGDILDQIDEDPKFLFGLSNTGRITTKSYEFSNAEDFQDLFGYSAFESRSAHVYEGLENIPIPGTVIMRFSGDAFVHYPINQLLPSGNIKDENDWGKLFDDMELESFDYSFTGSIDMGGKGISTILGVLPKMNDVLGYDIFGKEINLDLGAASEQVSVALLDESSILGDNSWRFGGEVRTPIIGDIFGEKLSKFVSQTIEGSGFLYLGLGTELEDWSLYLQGDTTIKIVVFESEYSSYFALNQDGIKTRGYFKAALGPLELTNVVTGSIGPEVGLELTTLCDKKIELRNGIVLQNTHLETSLSTSNGIKLNGTIDLPFGIVDADATGELGPDGISMTGSFTSAITLPDGTVISTYGAGLEFGISTNPDDGISLAGFIDAPHGIGSVAVEGYIRAGELYLHGNFDGNVDFNGVNLATANGEITISNAEGFKVSGGFEHPLTEADLSGFITNQGIDLEGGVTRGLTVAGNEFNLSRSYVHASSITGVQIEGYLNLYFMSTDISGSINPDNTFSLKGQRKLKLGPWDSTINTSVTQNGVSLSGSGCLDVPIIGTKCQSLAFQPNWAARTVRVCRGAICHTF